VLQAVSPHGISLEELSCKENEVIDGLQGESTSVETQIRDKSVPH
jgi:hypothetical protein